MSLWQIMKFRQGWVESKKVHTEEDQAKAEIEAMSDDDFFAAMEAEIVEGEKIAEDAFILAMKKGA